jgi:hypothetical protein
MSAPKESVPWDFEKLTDAISYHRQPSEGLQPKKNGSGPSLIVLCTWMSANRKHISKYTAQYRQKYPSTELLVIESSIADIVYRTNKSQRHRIRLARDILTSHLTATNNNQRKPQVLLHVFSNGGAQAAVQLATSLAPETRPQAFSAIIFDSCPGEATYQRSHQAMSHSLPKSLPARVFGPLLIHLTLCLFYLAIFVCRFESVLTRSRKCLNDPEMFGTTVPRVYVFSKADELVPWRDVESHAEDAGRKGYGEVRRVLFEDSAHCAHAMAHKEEYWGAVEGVVEGLAMRKS